MDNLHLPEPLRALAKDHFVLLHRENPDHRRDTLELRVSGYADILYLVNDIVKVCILALGDGENHDDRIPQPEVNVSGVLRIILDLLPYEEFDLLDKIREAVLDPAVEASSEWDDDTLLKSISLVMPSCLAQGKN